VALGEDPDNPLGGRGPLGEGRSCVKAGHGDPNDPHPVVRRQAHREEGFGGHPCRDRRGGRARDLLGGGAQAEHEGR